MKNIFYGTKIPRFTGFGNIFFLEGDVFCLILSVIFHPFSQKSVLFKIKFRIQGKDLFCRFAGFFENRGIVVDITDPKFHVTTLADSEQVAGTAEFEVFACDIKSIV